MVLVYFIFLYFLCFVISYKYNRMFVETVPLALGFSYLILYLLCFVNLLFLFDYISIIFIVLCLIYIYNNNLFINLFDYFKQPKSFFFIIIIIFGILTLNEKGVCHWDEWNFWIFDIKEIYSYQGFAPKGFNLIDKFGDYPPGVQLLSAYFMHLFGGYDEGLGYFAYYFMYIVYLLPLSKKISNNKTLLVMFVWLLLGFSFLTPIIMESRRPDFIIGVIYGYVLTEILDNKKDKFRLYSIAISLSVLSLIKTIGIQWVIFSIIFFFFIEKETKRQYKDIIKVFIISLCFYFSWIVFCKVNCRTNYIMMNLVDTLSGNNDNNIGILLKKKELLFVFIKAFLTKLNGNSFIIGISYAFFVIAVPALLSFVCKGKQYYKLIGFFIFFTGIIELLFLLFSVEVLFLDEINVYLDINNMIIIFNRYGAPYLIGSYMLFVYCFLNNLNININKFWICITVFSILAGSIGDVYCYYYEYKNWPNWIETDKREHSNNTLKAIDWLNENYNDKLLVFVGDDYDTTYIGYQMLPKYCKFLNVSEYSDEIVKLYYDTYQIKKYVFLCDSDSIKNINHNYLTNRIYNVDTLN